MIINQPLNLFPMETDLIIIGAGPGGYECAVKAARQGLKVTIIEAKAPGGTCLNEGCIPTKSLCHTAAILRELIVAGDYGIIMQASALDFTGAMARKNQIVSSLKEGIKQLMKIPGINYVEGRASFITSHTISVGADIYEAPHIIIATGSQSKCLSIPGGDLPRVVDSAEMLSLTKIPQRLSIIGGGVIGLEFASIFATFGSEVTVIEFCKEILPNFDKDIAKRLRLELKKQGITFKNGTAVTAITTGENENAPYLVSYEEKGKTSAIEADIVLMAVGRMPNIHGLNLEAIGVATTQRGITVDENMQTNIRGVYAVGDVNGLSPLAHAATFQSYRALNHITGQTDNIKFNIIPAAVFTVPELASIGLTEDECDKKEIPCTIHKSFYRANGKALTIGASEGLVKIITSPNGLILGAAILGQHASDLIHEVAVIMNYGGTLDQLKDIIHAHPTLSETILSAAEA